MDSIGSNSSSPSSPSSLPVTTNDHPDPFKNLTIEKLINLLCGNVLLHPTIHSSRWNDKVTLQVLCLRKLRAHHPNHALLRQVLDQQFTLCEETCSPRLLAGTSLMVRYIWEDSSYACKLLKLADTLSAWSAQNTINTVIHLSHAHLRDASCTSQCDDARRNLFERVVSIAADLNYIDSIQGITAIIITTKDYPSAPTQESAKRAITALASRASHLSTQSGSVDVESIYPMVGAFIVSGNYGKRPDEVFQAIVDAPQQMDYQQLSALLSALDYYASAGTDHTIRHFLGGLTAVRLTRRDWFGILFVQAIMRGAELAPQLSPDQRSALVHRFYLLNDKLQYEDLAWNQDLLRERRQAGLSSIVDSIRTAAPNMNAEQIITALPAILAPYFHITAASRAQAFAALLSRIAAICPELDVVNATTLARLLARDDATEPMRNVLAQLMDQAVSASELCSAADVAKAAIYLFTSFDLDISLALAILNHRLVPIEEALARRAWVLAGDMSPFNALKLFFLLGRFNESNAWSRACIALRTQALRALRQSKVSRQLDVAETIRGVSNLLIALEQKGSSTLLLTCTDTFLRGMLPPLMRELSQFMTVSDIVSLSNDLNRIGHCLDPKAISPLIDILMPRIRGLTAQMMLSEMTEILAVATAYGSTPRTLSHRCGEAWIQAYQDNTLPDQLDDSLFWLPGMMRNSETIAKRMIDVIADRWMDSDYVGSTCWPNLLSAFAASVRNLNYPSDDLKREILKSGFEEFHFWPGIKPGISYSLSLSSLLGDSVLQPHSSAESEEMPRISLEELRQKVVNGKLRGKDLVRYKVKQADDGLGSSLTDDIPHMTHREFFCVRVPHMLTQIVSELDANHYAFTAQLLHVFAALLQAEIDQGMFALVTPAVRALMPLVMQLAQNDRLPLEMMAFILQIMAHHGVDHTELAHIWLTNVLQMPDELDPVMAIQTASMVNGESLGGLVNAVISNSASKIVSRRYLGNRRILVVAMALRRLNYHHEGLIEYLRYYSVPNPGSSTNLWQPLHCILSGITQPNDAKRESSSSSDASPSKTQRIG